MEQAEASKFVLQLAVIVLSAKVVGRVFQLRLKQPSVLGELVAGVLIGPYALGRVPLPGMGPLFPAAADGTPLSQPLLALALLASIVLLFMAGLETDLQRFLRYSLAGLVVGLGGAVVSFIGAAIVMRLVGGADRFSDPRVLMTGTVAVATSVGITARVLYDKRKMDTAEGATILSAAVIDDIIGLVFLAVVLGLISHGSSASALPWMRIGSTVLKASGVWVAVLALGILLANRIKALLLLMGGTTAVAASALGVAFLVAALTEQAGLALIVGAYTVGLVLSKVDAAHEIHRRLGGVYEFFVPIFFCQMGMTVSFSNIRSALILGAALTAAGVIGKLIGAGGPALALGFNARGALRIGLGMVPRGEVALIVAGIGLHAGYLDDTTFAAAVLMSFATTIAASLFLAACFGDQPGRRRGEAPEAIPTELTRLDCKWADLAELVAERVAGRFRDNGFYVYRHGRLQSYEMRYENITVLMQQIGATVVMRSARKYASEVKKLLHEEIAALTKLFREAHDLGALANLQGSSSASTDTRDGEAGQ